VDVTRREFITVLGGVVVSPVVGLAQQSERIRLIGIVSPAPTHKTVLFDTFRYRLTELGYVEGRNIELDFRLAAGALDRIPTLASDLLHRPVDVLVADGAHVVSVLQSITKTVPTIAIMGVDPVGEGTIASLARPGGNITGVTTFAIELHSKRIGLFAEAFPRAKRVCFLLDESQDPRGLVFSSTEKSALQLGLQLENWMSPIRPAICPQYCEKRYLDASTA
jgi:ABC-type uncharacterized transport system substrate-binding protein